MPAIASASQLWFGNTTATIHVTGHFLAGGGPLFPGQPFVPGDPFELITTQMSFGGMDNFVTSPEPGPCEPVFGAAGLITVEQLPNCEQSVKIIFFHPDVSFNTYEIDARNGVEKVGELLSWVIPESFSFTRPLDVITVVNAQVVRLEEVSGSAQLFNVVTEGPLGPPRVPEPAAMGLLPIALLMLAFVAYRRRTSRT